MVIKLALMRKVEYLINTLRFSYAQLLIRKEGEREKNEVGQTSSLRIFPFHHENFRYLL